MTTVHIFNKLLGLQGSKYPRGPARIKHCEWINRRKGSRPRTMQENKWGSSVFSGHRVGEPPCSRRAGEPGRHCAGATHRDPDRPSWPCRPEGVLPGGKRQQKQHVTKVEPTDQRTARRGTGCSMTASCLTDRSWNPEVKHATKGPSETIRLQKEASATFRNSHLELNG